MIVLDTSVLVDSFGGSPGSSGVRDALERGLRLLVPSLVLYEWLRGPRVREELEAQEAIFPSDRCLLFGPQEAAAAAGLYTTLPRPRGREFDLAIAAHALVRDAEFWTLNTRDFEDVPELRLAQPS